MTLKHRRFLAAAFILVFIISAPLLIAHTAGFRFNSKKWTWQKTGSLAVETEPKKAKIFLNQILLKAQTPTIVNALFPGVYEVSIEKDGYRPWKKNIEITPEKMIFAKGIILFPEIIEKTGNKIFSKSDSPVLKNGKDFLIFSENGEWKLKADERQISRSASAYAIELSQDNSQKSIISLDAESKKKSAIASIPENSQDIFKTDGSSFAVLKTANNETLIGSINDGSFIEKDRIKDASDTIWDEKNLILAVASGLELTQYDFRKNPIEKTLILRSSRNIDRALLLSDFPYALIAQGSQLSIVEREPLGSQTIPIFSLQPEEKIIFWEADKKLRLSIWAQFNENLEYFELPLLK